MQLRRDKFLRCKRRLMVLDAGLSCLDTSFWQNHGQQNHFLTTIEHGGRCEKEQPKVGPKGEGVGANESNDTIDKIFAMGRMVILVDAVKHCNYRYHYENCKHTRNAF